MPQLEVSIQKIYTLKDKLLAITPERQGKNPALKL